MSKIYRCYIKRGDDVLFEHQVSAIDHIKLSEVFLYLRKMSLHDDLIIFQIL